MADLKGKTVDANISPKCKKIKDCARHDYAGVNGVGTAKMLFSPTRLSGERGFESTDSDSKHGSTLAFENSSKFHEADVQSSSIGVVKSEISTEMHLTPGNGSIEMDTKKTQKNHLIAAEDGLSTTMQDSQHMTESSCLNSFRRLPGRPRVKRRRDADEDNPKRSSDGVNYSRCGQTGHNKRTCEVGAVGTGNNLLILIVG